MVGHKVKMELVVNEKSRYRIFRNRQKGLKKKIHELSTLCDVKACMILYGPNAHGTESSQPDIWPENRNEVEGIIENYRKERKKDHGKRTLDLSDVLQTKKKTDLELRELQEKNVKTKTGVDEFSYEQLMQIIDKLDKKHEAVQNMIDSKKGKARLMSETTVGCSNMQGLSAEKPLNIKVPMDCQGTGVVESDLGYMMNQMGMMKVENHQYAEFGAGRASSSDIQYNNVQYHDPIHLHPALGVSKNMVLNPDPRTPTHQMGVSKNMVFMVDVRIPMQHMPTFMQYPMMSTDLGTDSNFW